MKLFTLFVFNEYNGIRSFLYPSYDHICVLVLVCSLAVDVVSSQELTPRHV